MGYKGAIESASQCFFFKAECCPPQDFWCWRDAASADEFAKSELLLRWSWLLTRFVTRHFNTNTHFVGLDAQSSCKHTLQFEAKSKVTSSKGNLKKVQDWGTMQAVNYANDDQ